MTGVSNAINGGMLVPVPTMAQMFPSGTYVDLLNPTPDAVHAGDIAHHTGMLCRYGGGVRRFYSVAEHMVLVARLLAWQGQPPELLRAGLLHDAVEAYAGDVIAPLKYALRSAEADLCCRETNAGWFQSTDNGKWFTKPPAAMRGIYSGLCDGLDRAIGERFGIDPELFDHPDVKLADMWALKIEAAELTFNGGKDWRYPGTIPNGGLLPDAVLWHGGLTPKAASLIWCTVAASLCIA